MLPDTTEPERQRTPWHGYLALAVYTGVLCLLGVYREYLLISIWGIGGVVFLFWLYPILQRER